MEIVNSYLAHNIREQDMIKPPNSYGYILLAAEVELPRFFLSNSASKIALLSELKVLSSQLKSSSPSIQRADVFDAMI